MRNNIIHTYKNIILSAFIISSIYVLIIAIKTNFGLLIGGDFPGYYDWRYPIHYNPYLPDMIYSLGLLLSNNNPYFGFYFYLIINIFISIFSLNILILELIYNILNENIDINILIIIIIISLYYISQPLLYVNTFKSILKGIVWIQYTASYSFLLISLLYLNKREYKKYYFFIFLAIIMGPMSLPFPNDIRLLSLYILTITLFSILLITYYNIKYLKNIIILFILLIIVIFIKIPEILAKKEIILTYSELHGLKMPRPLKAMNIIDVFILASAWTRYSKFCPYCSSYFSGPTTFFNTILVAITFTILILYIRRTKKYIRIYMLMNILLYILSIFHESRGYLMPNLYFFLYRKLPLASLFSYAAILGPIAGRYAYLLSLATVLLIIFKYKRRFFFILIIIIIITSLYSISPLISGSALSLFANSNIIGVHIPQEYYNLKYFLNKNHFNKLIILPQMSTYILEKWGYQGTQKFYHSFFYPLHVVYIGNYGEYINSTYYNLTTIKVKVVRLINLNNYIYTYYQNKILINLSYKYKISYNSVIVMSMSLPAECEIERIGIDGMNRVAWYLPYKGGLYLERKDDTVVVKIITGLFNKPWPSSRLPDHIERIHIIFKRSCSKFNYISINGIFIGKISGLDDNYIKELRGEHIDAIVVDRGVVSGNMTNPVFVDKILKLTKLKILMQNHYITLYSLDYN